MKISKFIVEKRNLFFFLFILLSIFSIFSMQWTVVQNDITIYLNPETDTRKGLTVMEDEFITYGSAEVMISNIDYATALKIAKEVEKVEGVMSLMFEDSETYYKNASAKFMITFDGISTDEQVEKAMEDVQAITEEYDVSYYTTVGVSEVENLAKEMGTIMVIVSVLIILVLLFTSKSYAEIPVLLLTFGVSAILNMGTNFIFSEISFISDSVAVVLQLALGIDYAIILCHRFAEERKQYEAIEASVMALSKAIIEISSSSVTTICGLIAMSFMDFKLGADLSMVLIKAIILSLLSVFLFMPGLLVVFSKWIDGSQHRNFVPSIAKVGEVAIKVRKVVLPLFIFMAIGGWYFSSNTIYLFSVNEVRAKNLNERQLQEDRIISEFGTSNAVVVLVPNGNYEIEATFIQELESYDQVDAVVGLANTEAIDGYMVTQLLTAREFAELMDLDYEEAKVIYMSYAIDDENYGKLMNQTDSYELPLINVILFVADMLEEGYVSLEDELKQELMEQSQLLRDGQKQLESENYSRILVFVDLPEESDETFAFLQKIKELGLTYYSEVYMVGNSTSNADLSAAFSLDNMVVSILSALFVMIVLLVTFGSVAVPIMLIIVIQSAIFINFAFPYIQGVGLFFIGYLVVSSIQMGANVDYAIVITNRFLVLRKELDDKKAVIKALDESFATVVTSGSILGFAGIILQNVTTDGTIGALGECIGRGTFISMFLVIFILPQILYVGAKLIDKTSFSKSKEKDV